MPIIANGDTLVAHHNPGDTSFLLVTFIGAFHEGEVESRYLMKEIVEIAGISCVGLTARVRHLYICPEIEEIAAQVRAMRQPGQKLIILGQSSGGFAAVKFANLFDADYAVALSPIFSMDEQDLGLTEDMQQEREFLQTAIRFHRAPREIIRPGMRPGPEDCSAPILFVYDSEVESDNYAMNRFIRLFPAAHYVRAKHFGHAVFDKLNEHRPWLSLLNLLATDHVGAAVQLLSRMTRNNDVAIAELLLRITRWRPAMLPVALRTARVRDYLTEKTRQRCALDNVMAYELAARGDGVGAVATLRALHPALFPDVPPTEEEQAGRGLFMVLSWHGGVLTYDNDHGHAAFSGDTLRNTSRMPALLDLRGATPRLVVQLRSGEHNVALDMGGEATQDAEFEVVPERNGLVAFRRGSHYLWTSAHGLPSFRSDRLDDWERYALLLIPEQSLLREKLALSWFDQTVMSVRAEDRIKESAKAAPAARVAQASKAAQASREGQAEADDDTARRKVAFRSFLRFFSG